MGSQDPCSDGSSLCLIKNGKNEKRRQLEVFAKKSHVLLAVLFLPLPIRFMLRSRRRREQRDDENLRSGDEEQKWEFTRRQAAKKAARAMNHGQDVSLSRMRYVLSSEELLETLARQKIRIPRRYFHLSENEHFSDLTRSFSFRFLRCSKWEPNLQAICRRLK